MIHSLIKSLLLLASTSQGYPHGHVHFPRVTIQPRGFVDNINSYFGEPQDYSSTEYDYETTSDSYYSSSTTYKDVSSSRETTITPSSSYYNTASSTYSESSSTSTFVADSEKTLEKYSSAFGIAFSQYDDNGACKSEEQLQKNFEAMSKYSVIRLYHTDCDSLSYAMKYKASHQKLFVGMYDPTAISDSVSSIKSALKIYSNGSIEDHIYAITVGNEHVNDGKYTASEMVDFLQQAKEQLSDIGYNGKVSIVDTFNTIQSFPELCTNEFSSLVTANAHPFFSGVDASTGGSWLKTTISDLQDACGNASVLISETGWPTKGDSIGNSVPSIVNQANALKSAIDEVADSIILFSGWNELWKQDGNYGVEKYWGINDLSG